MAIHIGIYWPGTDFVETHFGMKRWLSFYVFSMKAFGADSLCVVGLPNISVGYEINIKEYPTTESLLEDHRGFHFVSFIGDADIALQDFDHPEGDVLYVFGNDYGDIPEGLPGQQLRIDNPGGINHLWSHCCVSMALYDRYVKGGHHGSN